MAGPCAWDAPDFRKRPIRPHCGQSPGNHQAAAQLCRGSLRIWPMHTSTKGSTRQAEIEFKRVLELEPQTAEARCLLGMTYLNEKRAAGCERLVSPNCSPRIQTMPTPTWTRAWLSPLKDNHQAAIQEYKSAAKLIRLSSCSTTTLAFPTPSSKCTTSHRRIPEGARQNGDDIEIENALAEAYQAKGMNATSSGSAATKPRS